MTLSPTHCYTSEMIYGGGSTWTDECVIDVIGIIDTNYVRVKVYPLHEGAITLTMKEGQPYNFVEFQAPFQITPTSVFYGATSQAVKFQICALVEPPKPTLYVYYIQAGLDPGQDVPQYDRFGVQVHIIIKGTGVGILKIDWGNDHSETKTGIVAGTYAYDYNLPPGAHNICAELFNIEL